MSQHSGGEEKAQFSSTLTRQQGGLTGRLHLKKGTVEPKPPYGRTFLREEVFDNRVPFFTFRLGRRCQGLRALCFFFSPGFVCSSHLLKLRKIIHNLFQHHSSKMAKTKSIRFTQMLFGNTTHRTRLYRVAPQGGDHRVSQNTNYS
ncbi:hypothetical protein AB432_025035 [Brevibacillus brevis]|uniref:Uncharacterized protein n=1 Tax=Brevibacillus brevis TaxID=1393 RepID=A0A2Z4MP08_BREBE|nr:hypothetical protein AB432_025035 [Brevibacillus brevis]